MTLKSDMEYFAYNSGYTSNKVLFLKPFLEWMQQYLINTKLTYTLRVTKDTLNTYDGIINEDLQTCVFIMREYDFTANEHDLHGFNSAGYESVILESKGFLEFYNALNQFKTKVHKDCQIVFFKKYNELLDKNISISIRSERCIVISV